MQEYLGNRYAEETIKKLASNNDIVVFPETYTGVTAYNFDTIDLIKILKEKGVKVGMIEECDNIIEKHDADIVINLGMITATLISPILVEIVKYFTSKSNESKSKEMKRNVKIAWYSTRKEKFFSYDGPIDDINKILKNLMDSEKHE